MNVNEPADKLQERVDALAPMGPDLIKYGLAALAAILLLYVLLRFLRGRRRKLPLPPPETPIDISTLPATPLPPGAPVLTYYHVPVRLMAMVLAPAGRLSEIPPENERPGLVDMILPGLAQVVTTHRPVIRLWSHQLSVRGFAHKFFAKAQLPGNGGKGTEWSSIAGMVRFQGKPFMVGMVLRSAAPTSLGQRVVEEEAQWLDVLRVKGE